MQNATLATLILAATMLAGCTDAETGADAPPLDEEARQQHLRSGLQADDLIAGPDWEPGQWWGYHIFFGADDEEGIHFNMAVVEDQGSEWLVATDHRDAAMYHAIFDFSVMGTFSKQDLSTTADGLPWQWYQWPLTDGAQYSSTVQITDFDTGEPQSLEVDWSVTYNPSIFTQDGNKPGFDVVGTVDGKRFLEYDYVPYLGWFGHLYQYSLSENATEEDWEFHIMTMGSGNNWTGDYYLDTATALLEHDRWMFFNPDSPPDSHVGQEVPIQAVPIDEEADRLYGYLYSYAWSGDHETVLTDAANQQKQHLTATASPADDFAFQFAEFVEDEPVAGDWHVGTAGAGVVAGGGAFLWEIQETIASYPA